jgi:hypothetical protein
MALDSNRSRHEIVQLRASLDKKVEEDMDLSRRCSTDPVLAEGSVEATVGLYHLGYRLKAQGGHVAQFTAEPKLPDGHHFKEPYFITGDLLACDVLKSALQDILKGPNDAFTTAEYRPLGMTHISFAPHSAIKASFLCDRRDRVVSFTSEASKSKDWDTWLSNLTRAFGHISGVDTSGMVAQVRSDADTEISESDPSTPSCGNVREGAGMAEIGAYSVYYTASESGRERISITP